jgi:colanic acid biosynthesis glycosyl transferase WcaI
MANFLLLTQVYPPDPAAVGQHFEDAAIRLARRGHTVTVYAADRDYDNPSIRYGTESRHERVKVVRLPFSSFGKKTLVHRLVGQFIYLIQVFLRLAVKRNVDGVVLTTIPATTGVMYVVLRLIRNFKTLYWVMDINPDQAIAQGIVKEGSLTVRALSFCNRTLIKRSSVLVVLDHYMMNRILNKTYITDPEFIHMIPPWPLEDHLEPIPRERNHFLDTHNLRDKTCVFMYSGNHSLVHPLTTVIEAIKERKDDNDLEFMFIGGGRGKGEVEKYITEYSPVNVASLPYQPLSELSYSLSAADVHIVVMGDEMVGIVHPCKIYGAMAVAKPILFIGPKASHLAEIVSENKIGWVVEHGDIEGLQKTVDEISIMPREQLQEIGIKSRDVLTLNFSADKLAEEFCNLVETLNK